MTGTQTNSVHRSERYVFEIDTGELTASEALDELRGASLPRGPSRRRPEAR
jgi:hypothetical protein